MNFGIIGFGRIARKFVKAIEAADEGKIYAIGSRSVSMDDPYLKEHPEVKVYKDYEELLNDPQVDAVYIALTHKFHKEWILKSLEHHIPVLSEKPLVLKSKDVNEIRKK
ncbi:MAG: Gfo/Idh/MocA family protein [Anaerostipes sp.]